MLQDHPHSYTLAYFNMSAFSLSDLLRLITIDVDPTAKDFYNLVPHQLSIDLAVFNQVSVVQTKDRLVLSCSCGALGNGLCSHQVRALYNLMDRDALRLFFDANLRAAKLRNFAVAYGLQHEPDLDKHFELVYANNETLISPRIKQLFAVGVQNQATTKLLTNHDERFAATKKLQQHNQTTIVVYSAHRFYSHLTVGLYHCTAPTAGKVKNPLVLADPLQLIWKVEDPAELKFLTAVLRFQQSYTEMSGTDLEGLKALAKNPFGWAMYTHDSKLSANISANSIVPITVKCLVADLVLTVNQKNDFYEVSACLQLADMAYDLSNIQLIYQYFIPVGHTWNLITDPYLLNVIDFFKKHHDQLLVHQSKFEVFEQTILSKLEEKVRINYSYLKPATKTQQTEKGFDLENEQLIYLSESEDYVLLTPVVRYSNTEIPILTRKQIRAKDKHGRTFTVRRNDEEELQLITNISKQHPYFQEQLDEGIVGDCFYMHRKHFLETSWFLDAFEAWRSKGINLLGFNKLANNKLSPYKADISIKVISGINWFETLVKVKYNGQAISLKHLHQSIRNKSKFVKLDDGTLGLLPDAWIKKFEAYFNAGELADDHIRTHQINYNLVSELYEAHLFDESVKKQLALYHNKLSGPDQILPVAVPDGLLTELRNYQQEGLNWLNFLDEFNFGACLADDMGLGKTIQVIAFILSQRKKVKHNTNLVVVPASLIFNWQEEIAKFAPSLKLHTLYGTERSKHTSVFEQYEVVLTSYGTLLADIRFLKSYTFNYIFLDESQTIKNPDSQRYKAVRLLQSRNKVVLTGTPIENNTFDLYGQLSFACPGLLGSKQQFKELYAVPIDQFKDAKRAKELQKKISPFILRRTKEQVAKELPDKTEMVVYCEMGTEQRAIYEAAVQEIKDGIAGKTEDDLAKSSMYILTGMTRLRQICNAAALLKDDQFYGHASAKMDVLMEQLQSKAPNHKILVFSQFVGMLDLIKQQLYDKGIGFSYLSGQTRNRQQVVNNFQDDPTQRVFLISLKAGGIGLNLTHADYVYLVDPWWNPAVENQAIDRAYRIGQQKNVVAVRLICPDTIEEKIMKLQNSKKGLVNELIKTDAALLKNLSKKDLLELF